MKTQAMSQKAVLDTKDELGTRRPSMARLSQYVIDHRLRLEVCGLHGQVHVDLTHGQRRFSGSSTDLHAALNEVLNALDEHLSSQPGIGNVEEDS